jgi:hypothetical protein
VATYYVGKGGNDANDGLSWDTRKLNISAIEKVLQPGDVVYMEGIGKEKELFDAIDGLMAFDAGMVDSGIKDEALRKQTIDYLNTLSEDDLNLVLSKFVKWYYLRDLETMKDYGLASIKELLNWLADQDIYL